MALCGACCRLHEHENKLNEMKILISKFPTAFHLVKGTLMFRSMAVLLHFK